MSKAILVMEMPEHELHTGEMIANIDDDGFYQITSEGRIWSKKSNRFLTPTKDKNGYLLIKPFVNGAQKTYRVHRLVAEAFIDNPYSLPEVNHKDENKENNSFDNLEWCTHQYNATYGTKCIRSGQKLRELYEKDPSRVYWRGKHHTKETKRKLSEYAKTRTYSKSATGKPVHCVELNMDFSCAKEAGDVLNVHPGSINHCCNGKYKTAGDYHWYRINDCVEAIEGSGEDD